MVRAAGLALIDRGVHVNQACVLSATRRRRSTLGYVLACLLGLAAGVTHAQSAQRHTAPAQTGAEEITGVVKSTLGPEAGVWVIAETNDFATRFAKIVVTDDQGRYLVPDLPKANYIVWVRGYGLADSAKVRAVPGQARQSDRRHRARRCGRGAGLSGRLLVRDAEIARGSRDCATCPVDANAYLMWIKNMGCVGCHQLGNLATRTLTRSLGQVRLVAGRMGAAHPVRPGGQDMVGSPPMGSLSGIPLKYLADWTDRIAAGELPARQPQRPTGIERNVVATVRDWADPQSLPARSFRNRSAQSHRQRLRPAVRFAGAEHG